MPSKTSKPPNTVRPSAAEARNTSAAIPSSSATPGRTRSGNPELAMHRVFSFWNGLPVSTKRWITVMGFVALLVQLLEFPHHTFDCTHDLSSHAAFEYYAAHHFQFGTEVYQNVGPYGYVHYAYSYIGYLHCQKVILKCVCRLVLVMLIFWMIGRIGHPVAKLCWWLGFFVFFGLGDQTQHDYLDVDENYAYLTIYLAGLWLLQDRKDRVFLGLSSLLWGFVAFMSLTKHTCFMLGMCIVVVAAAQNVFRRNWIAATLGLLAFCGWLSVHWILAGQRIGNLPAFVRGIFAFSGGYNEAMALNEPLSSAVLALSLVALMAARIGYNWWSEKRQFGRAVLESFLLFVIWKHAFVRADPIHTLILFYAALLFAIPFCFARTGSPAQQTDAAAVEAKWMRRLAVVWCVALLALSIVSFYAVIPNCHYRPARIWNNLQHNLSWLISPAKRTRDMEKLLAQAKENAALPRIKALVGDSRIDLFGYQPGYILLNDLNYWSRPMPISFAAVNPLLEKANEEFYRNPATAPKFVLCALGGIDDRLYMQDDALAVRALLELYRPVLAENGLLLLERLEKAERLQEKLLEERNVGFGQPLVFTAPEGRLLWLEADVERTFAGKLMSFFYKAPPCFVGLKFEGEKEFRFSKFVTSIGGCGFIINPLLINNIELANVYAGDAVQPTKATLMFVCDPDDKKFFKQQVRLRWRLLEQPR